MNTPHSLPDSSTPKAEDGFSFDAWNLTEEKGLTESAALFDGKIIARMPDLGSEGIAKNITKPKFPSFWGQVSASTLSFIQGGNAANAVARQQFFHRVTAFGGIVLLIGVGILFFDQSRERQTENVTSIAEILAENAASSTIGSFAAISESAFSPILQSESENTISSIVSNSTIPVAPVESVAAVSPSSPWDRPAADLHSAWAVTPASQPENPFQPIEVAAIDAVPVMPSETVVMSPMTPIATASVPVLPHEMAVSPFEIQMIAQSSMPHPPAGAHIQPNHSAVPPGMMPMHERLQYMSNTAPQQIPHWHPSAQQQLSPPVHGHVVPVNNPHGQSRQNPQYVVPPSYMLPHSQRGNNQVIPQGVPIPSGVSTLSPQGGQHMQPHGMPTQRPPNNFYTPPPTSRWM